MFIIVLGSLLILFSVLVVYSCCVTAKRHDERAERFLAERDYIRGCEDHINKRLEDR